MVRVGGEACSSVQFVDRSTRRVSCAGRLLRCEHAASPRFQGYEKPPVLAMSTPVVNQHVERVVPLPISLAGSEDSFS